MNSDLDAIIVWGIYILAFYALRALPGYILIYGIRPLCPEWWERNIAAPDPFDFEADCQAGAAIYLSIAE